MTVLNTKQTNPKHTTFGAWLMTLDFQSRKSFIKNIFIKVITNIPQNELIKKRKRFDNWRYKGLGNPSYLAMKAIFDIAFIYDENISITDLFPNYKNYAE